MVQGCSLLTPVRRSGSRRKSAFSTHVRDKPFVRRRARDASESEEVPNPPRDPRNVAADVEPVPFVLDR